MPICLKCGKSIGKSEPIMTNLLGPYHAEGSCREVAIFFAPPWPRV